LGSEGVDFVACRTTVDGVTSVLVDDFEGSGFSDIKIFEPWFLDGTFLEDKACAEGVVFADGNGMGFFHNKSILLAVDGGINSQRKDMLMMCCEDLIVDDSAVWKTLFVHGFMDGLGRQDSRGTDFEMNIRCLAELPGLTSQQHGGDVEGGRGTKMYS